MSNGVQKKPLVFRVNDHGQGPELLHQVFLERGWVEFDEDEQDDNDWNMWWRTSRFRLCDYENIHPWQRLNHYPKSTGITRKDCLVRHMKRMKGVHGAGMYNFSPLSFNLPNDYTRFVAEYGKLKGKIDPKQFAWICKPADMSRGRGIFLFRDISELQYDCNAVVQQYISNPLLIGGYKFDIRLYVAVPSFHPLTVYVFQEGIVRFSTEKYDLTTLNNVFAHLTNTSINKHSPSYTTDKERIGPGCKWTLTQLRYYFHQNSLDDRLLWARIANIIILTLLIQAPQVPKEKNCYELYGFDILIDDKMKPWLLEVNFSPALSTDCQTDIMVKKPMLHDLMDMLNFKENDSERGGAVKQMSTGRVTARGRMSANIKNRPDPIDRNSSSSRLSQRGSIQRMNSSISNVIKTIEPTVIEHTLSFIQQDNPSINKPSEEKMCYGLPLVNPSDDEKDDSDCESVRSSTKSEGIEADVLPSYTSRSNLCTPTPLYSMTRTDSGIIEKERSSGLFDSSGTMSSIVKRPDKVNSANQRGDKMSLKSFGNSDSAYSSFSDNSDKVPVTNSKNSKTKTLHNRRRSFTVQSALQNEILSETPSENEVFHIKSLRPTENSKSLRKVSNRGTTVNNMISFRSKTRVNVPHIDRNGNRSRNFDRGPSRNFERGPSRNFDNGPLNSERAPSRNIGARTSSRFGHVTARSDFDITQKNRSQVVVSSMSTISKAPREKETINLGLNGLSKKNPPNRFKQKSRSLSVYHKVKGPPPRVGEFFLVFPFNEGTHKAANTTLDPHIVIKETQKLFKELKVEVDKSTEERKFGGLLPYGTSVDDERLWAPVKPLPEET
ncbi:putative tubulin polyglutamylase ttll2 [Mactra antiquata]